MEGPLLKLQKEGVMKNDDPKVSPRQKKPQAPDSAMSGGWSGNHNGHETNERSRVCNEVKTEVNREPTVSLRRVESNRRNSQKSTGPKTATGKKRVSRNAVRRGFFSKFLLIQHRDGKESQNEYDDFYTGVRKHEPCDGRVRKSADAQERRVLDVQQNCETKPRSPLISSE